MTEATGSATTCGQRPGTGGTGPEAPPTRLSIDDADLDWDMAMRLEVLLDGNVIEATAYDIEAGTVERWMIHTPDPDAIRVTVPFDPGKPIRETLRGKVEVRWKT